MSSAADPNITSVLKESRTFPPSASFVAQANVSGPDAYAKLWQQAADDPEGFWAEQAESLHWFRRWDRVLDWQEPHAKWFVGGRTNVSYNCLDRHLSAGRANKAALVWEGEPGDTRVLRYQDLHREVCKFANVLKDRDARLRPHRGDALGGLRRLLGRRRGRPEQ
jgi:acetyl-CoA synthetase